MFLPGWAFGQDPAVSREWLTYACALAAVFGHCYPVWYEFRGGKGAATTLGVVVAVWPMLMPVEYSATAGGTGIMSFKLSFLKIAKRCIKVLVLLKSIKARAKVLEATIGTTEEESAPPAIPISILPVIIDSATFTVD